MNTEGTDLLRTSPRTFRRTMVRTVAEPSLYLDFTASNALDPRITFSRASTATFFNSLGVLSTAASGAPRFDYDPSTLAPRGFLIEEQRQNLLLQSNSFDTSWTNTNSADVAAQGISPDGTNTAWSLTDDAVNSNHNIFQSVVWAAAATTFSIYAKFVTHRWIGVRIGASGNQFFGSWDLQNGVVGSATAGATIGIQAVGNGWYRLTLTASLTTAGTANLIIAMNNADATSLTSYSGTGTTFLIYGAQLEAGATATSYIPTTTTALTRNADVASMTGTNFSSWYNQSEGTLLCAYNIPQTNGSANWRLWEIDDSSSASQRMRCNGSTAWVYEYGTDGSAGPGNVTTGAHKIIGAYKVNDLAACLDGGTVGTDTNVTNISTFNRLSIGGSILTANRFTNGTISRLAYYPTRLANAQLQALTA